MQVAWPLRHPGVDRPAAVSVSSFFSFMFTVPLFLHSIFILSASPFSSVLLYWQCPYHNISSSTTSLPSSTLLYRVNAAHSQCRCGSTSCVGFGATCGPSFRQTWPRRCSARCCPRRYSCWCRDTPVSVPPTEDTCKSGTAILAHQCNMN